MIRIVFVIRALCIGGAERQLVELVKRLDKTRFAVTVAVFYEKGELRAEIDGLKGVRVVCLGKRGRWDVLGFLWRWTKLVREVRPHIVHGYMGVANELGLMMGRLVGARVIWGLRASNMDMSQYDRLGLWTYRAGAALSRLPDLTIVNSQAGKDYHIGRGYSGRDMVVIPNGIDTQRLHPDAEAGRRMRRQWSIDDARPVIGIVGRLDPMKDHPTFLQAAALLANDRPDVRFVCVGIGPEAYKRKLVAQAEALGLADRVLWAGPYMDMLPVYNALTLLTSTSSFGEGFSNVVGEAMACGVPCVATDVGDAAVVVGDTGYIVPPQNPGRLHAAWTMFLALPQQRRTALSRAARQRIAGDFSLPQLARRTESAIERLLAGPLGAPNGCC